MLSAVRKDSVLSRACWRRVFVRRNALAAVAQTHGALNQKKPEGRGAHTLGRRPGEGAAPGPDEQPPRGVVEHDGHVLWPHAGVSKSAVRERSLRRATHISDGGEEGLAAVG